MNTSPHTLQTATTCVHAGTRPDTVTGGVNSPIYPSSATEYMDRDHAAYPRYFNTPNQQAVVEKMCALEHAAGGVLFSSGMAAISSAVLSFVGAGDHVVVQDDLYGGTHAFVTDLFGRFGIAHTFVATDAGAVEAAIGPHTKLILVESPSNPLLNIIDIRRIAQIARGRNILTLIDNTFASPVNQTPLDLGIDMVVHSGTKYLGGHSDLCCGVALAASAAHADRIRQTAVSLGGSLNATSCYLLERSLKTLALRVERQTANAVDVARFLAASPGVSRVNYPGLETHPGHAIAKSQMRGYGAMLSFDLAESVGDVDGFLARLRLIRPRVSLGGLETTICVSAKTSHAKISPEERRRIGVGDRLLRVSVGIEDSRDLIADISQAFAKQARAGVAGAQDFAR